MRILVFVLSSLGLVACVPTAAAPTDQVSDFDRGVAVFDAVRAYDHVITQVDFGPRVPGSTAHERTAEWIAVLLTGSGWTVEFQPFEYGGYQLRNIIARDMTSSSKAAPIILGAHYDTRFYADYDNAAPDQPVPGANDGASGVAVLLELARVLDTGAIDQPVWLVFFDAEDNGRIQGWDWILGSRHFVDVLDVSPSLAVIVDMVGDTDLQIYYEKNSDPILREEIWAVAASLGIEEFIPEEKYSILDDHTPFLQAGIPAVDIIDFDYPYFHTTEDLPDKVSPESLGAVGRTIEIWLEQNY